MEGSVSLKPHARVFLCRLHQMSIIIATGNGRGSAIGRIQKSSLATDRGAAQLTRNPIHATTRTYHSVDLLSLLYDFGDSTRAIEVEDRNRRRRGAARLRRRRRTSHESPTR